MSKNNEKMNNNIKSLTYQYNNLKNKLFDRNKDYQNTIDELKEIKKVLDSKMISFIIKVLMI